MAGPVFILFVRLVRCSLVWGCAVLFLRYIKVEVCFGLWHVVYEVTFYEILKISHYHMLAK